MTVYISQIINRNLYNLDDRDDPDDVMETSLTIDYDKQWLNCVSNRPLVPQKFAM